MAVQSLRCCTGFLKLQKQRLATLQLQCKGFLLWWLPLLWSSGSAVVIHGLSCPVAFGIFSDRGIEPVSPTLAGRCLTTEPPGKPVNNF